MAAKLVSPTGEPTEIMLTPDAPGRYGSSATLGQIGRYTLVWENGGDITRHSFLRSQQREPASSDEPVARRYVRDGLLKEWSRDSAGDLAQRASPRDALISLALLLLLATIAAERIPLSWLKQVLRQR
jgi:hypothetical protein